MTLQKEVNFKTFGCKVNTYDTGLLQQRFQKSGLDFSNKPEIHVLNTCAVTAEATREAVKTVKRLKKEDPNCVVVVTGCAAQVDKAHFADLPEADLVVANSHKGKLEELIADFLEGRNAQKVHHSNIFKKDDLEAGGGVEESHTRSFLKVQDGCNSFCSYCVIPFARGKSRSMTVQQIVDRVNELYSQGVRETVITGIHLGAYCEPGKTQEAAGLEALMETLLEKTEMPRFRLGSLEPQELTPRLLDLYANPRMCAHFHMSIQSAQGRILGDMKRQYNEKDVERALTDIKIRVPGAFVGMDVIVGFPGEDEEAFEETYQRLAKLYWSRIHVFPYSPRPGTVAARLKHKHIERSQLKDRARRLRELSHDRYAEHALAQVGTVKKVMPLKNAAKGGAQGLSRDYWHVACPELALENLQKEVKVKIIGFDQSQKSRMDGCLTGEIVES